MTAKQAIRWGHAFWMGLLLLALAAPLARAQSAAGSDSSSAADSAAAGSADAGGSDAEVTESASDKAGSQAAALAAALGEGWQFGAAGQFFQTYDDNVFLFNSLRRADTASQFTALFSAADVGKRLQFHVEYIPEYTLYSRYTQLNSLAHTYQQSLAFSFSPRTEIRWTADAHKFTTHTNFPFASLNFGGFNFLQYSLQALESGANVYDAESTVSVIHRSSEHSRFYADSNDGTTQFIPEGVLPAAFTGSRRAFVLGADVGWEHDLSARRTVGISAQQQYFRYLDPNYHRNYQSLLLHLDQKLPHNFLVSLSGGPSWRETRGIPSQKPGLENTYAVVAGVSRVFKRSLLRVSVQNSDQLGLLQEEASSRFVTGEFIQQLGQHLEISLAVSGGRAYLNRGQGHTDDMTAMPQISYRLAHNLFLFVDYGFSHQRSSRSVVGIRNFDRNQVAIGISREFGRTSATR